VPLDGERAPAAPAEADGVAQADDPLPETATHVIAGAGASRAPAESAEPATVPAEPRNAPAEPATATAQADSEEAPAIGERVRARQPRRGPAREATAARRSRKRRVTVLAVIALVLALIFAGGYVAVQSVYFIGTNDRGLVTLFRGVPFRLPLGISLYQSDYVTGVSASTITLARRKELLDHSLRSEGNAVSLIHSLELGQIE
jgi:protein phosphatase